MGAIPHRYADDIYDDLWLPQETREVRARIRDFAEQFVRPVAHELNNAGVTQRVSAKTGDVNGRWVAVY